LVHWNAPSPSRRKRPTTVNLTFQVGEVSERVTVDTTSALINYEHHQVGGLVTRQQIENLPLYGRNFLELAKLDRA